MARSVFHLVAFVSVALFATQVAAQSTWEVIPTEPGAKPGRALDLNNQAHVLTAKGRYDEAIAAAKEAIRLLPKYGTAYNNLGFAYLQKGELDLAIEAFNDAIRILGLQPVTLNSRGKAYLKKGDYDAALKDINASIRLMPSYSHAYNNRGMVYEKKGELDRAIADYSEALRLKPDLAEALTNRGNAYKAKGNEERANADFAQAARHSSSNPASGAPVLQAKNKRTVDFKYYTLEVPGDWEKGRSPDGTLQIFPQGIFRIKPHTDGSPDMDAIMQLIDRFKKDLPKDLQNPKTGKTGAKWGPMIQDFVTKDLGEHRSMMRGVFRMNASTIVALYYVIGPSYIVSFIVGSKHSIDTTFARSDPIFASLKWIAKP